MNIADSFIYGLSFEKNVNFKQKPYFFSINNLFKKMKAYLWKYSKIDLIKSYSEAIDNEITFVLT